MKKPTQSDEDRGPTETKKERPDAKVPEWAEDMEHTLRRLVREREKERSKNPGLYR